MNVNMQLNKEELNNVFEVFLKTAISNNITLNFNIDLKSMETPVVTYTEEETQVIEPTKVELEDSKLVTFSRCLDCGCVQAVNTSKGNACYVCGEELPTDRRPYKGTCVDCGEEIHVDILGTGVDYVSCPKCRKRYTIKLDFNQTQWVNKY